ncbi:MAG TPA: tungstate ABC transporter substrate-binding protein WtpA [Deltaproteobacteria bacterium]|nr:tungstate ABC transporter substrate-binding protein WtpA [Deltaproteobacteria bacterium]
MKRTCFSPGSSFVTVLLLLAHIFFSSPLRAEPTGRLIVFNAGSLAVPFRVMKQKFTSIHPRVRIELEAAGSRTCARKITDLKRPCDVMASADYTVIENLLIPRYADWNISFATNEMAIMYRPESRLSKEINMDNWYRILLRQGVEYGRSDPNSDPCGYRTMLVWQLAEKYYQAPGLYQKLVKGCPPKNVRPKETDLIAMLEAGEIDYLFIYRSVCEQHSMPFVRLPARINLKSARYEAFYREAKIKISGRKPGEFIVKRGKPMVYGITIPRGAPNRDAALQFVSFVVGPEGQEIMRQQGQPPISPPEATGKVDRLPPLLRRYVELR